MYVNIYIPYTKSISLIFGEDSEGSLSEMRGAYLGGLIWGGIFWGLLADVYGIVLRQCNNITTVELTHQSGSASADTIIISPSKNDSSSSLSASQSYKASTRRTLGFVG